MRLTTLLKRTFSEDKETRGGFGLLFFMFYLILITILGINIAPFFTADKIWFFWNAQGLWAQVGILLCFSFTFFEKAKFERSTEHSVGIIAFMGRVINCCCLFSYTGRREL